MTSFSFARFAAMLHKESLQMRRDPGTIGMTVMLPLIQLFLFGYAINTNPRHLPTAILSADHSRYERSIVAALANTSYFDLREYNSEHDVDRALARGDIMFALHIPPSFAREVDRGEMPSILVEADATDPTAIAAASAAMQVIVPQAVTHDLPPEMRQQADAAAPAFKVTLHSRYNPEQITAFNIIPGLIGTILSFSTLLITTLAITREREAGTMENLLSMPITPLEVMLGKIVPYVGLGYVQALLILTVAVFVFHVPVLGSIPLLVVALGLFIGCNLALGFIFSSIARTQMQAQQMSTFALLPQMLLSGFLFPFAGMPGWAQTIGAVLPLTHILRICRGVLLKGNGIAEIGPDLWPMALFALMVGAVAVRTYKRTLD
jgi:ABC-type multidrug transport system permease subunit